VYLFVMDLQTDRVYIVDLFVECPQKQYIRVLYDSKDYGKLKDFAAIKSYCEKCAQANKNPVARSKGKNGNNDLLEFEF
jgi:hypothetical protein